jgi:UDP-N-acetylmuramate: L-alanyl-gamma-D-glutamyl-meso-diaminopimelate ligase
LKFHFSGVCGAGMGNVACLLKELGHEVKGSDANVYPPMSDQLKDLGIAILNGYGENQLSALFDPEIQVISNVLSKDHPEVLAGQAMGLEQVSFPQALKRFILPGRQSYVVAGTHGKTTTSSILSELLKASGAGCFVGGVMKSGEPGCRLGDLKSPFVLEGDEYDTAFFDKHSKFLHYSPKVLLLTHLEWDHVDIFPTFEDMKKEFRALLKLLPENGLLIYCGDHPVLEELRQDFFGRSLSYGLNSSNDVVLESSGSVDQHFELQLKSPWGQKYISTSMIGRIYHLNLIGAWLSAHLGSEIPWPELQSRLGDFSGAQRRMEILSREPALVISDFAHHPTAIAETIQLVKEAWPKERLVAVFDPRNATSRRNVFESRLVEALGLADLVRIGPAPEDHRLAESEKLDVLALANKIGTKARGYACPEQFCDDIIHERDQGGIILVMSCGACHGLLDKLSVISPLEP